MKTEVYSWRVSRELKSGLEREARRRKVSLSAVLDEAASDWLSRSSEDSGSEEEQKRLHAAAAKVLGAFAGGNPDRSSHARQAIRERLRKQHDR